MNPENIRNFSIVAHIDHGKTTLSDRLLEITGALTEREMEAQVLDSMDLERERGITIKAHAVSMHYTADNGQEYLLNLIDTPGHVDFGYQVSSSLAACEGALLVVDATQGVEAQTLANAYLAVENNLEILPVINKIDLPSADPDRVAEEVEQVVGLDAADALPCSAKAGTGIKEILEAVIAKLPTPDGDPEAPLRALVFDSWYDSYRGAVMLVRVVDGRLDKKDKVRLMSSGRDYEILELGRYTPKPETLDYLGPGMVGYVVAGIKELDDCKVGDTITHTNGLASEPLPGFKEVKPMVFSGLFPVDSSDYENLRDAIEKLRLNDASFSFQPESSEALGFGFRCGFLGLLHMEIIQERLEREYNLELINTAPSVEYLVHKIDGTVLEVHTASDMPEPQFVVKIEEPIFETTIITQSEFLGGILKLLEEKRGIQKKFEYISATTVMLTYAIPLNEIVIDFYDRLKTISRGYASMDYQLAGFQEGKLSKLDILVNGKPVDALSIIVHHSMAYERGRSLARKLKELIHRQLFEVVIQATIGNKVISREVVKALRKNVTAKCYGGDISRKRKLLEKQKEGKKRMKNVGNVEIPQEAFLSVLKIDS